MAKDTGAPRRGRPADGSQSARRERKALIMAEATVFGRRRAAERHGITERTVNRYVADELKDPEMSRLYRKKLGVLESEWRQAAVRTQLVLLAKVAELGESAEVGQLRDVIGGIKIIGELLVVEGMTGGKQPHAPVEDPAPETPPSPGSGASAGNGAHPTVELH